MRHPCHCAWPDRVLTHRARQASLRWLWTPWSTKQVSRPFQRDDHVTQTTVIACCYKPDGSAARLLQCQRHCVLESWQQVKKGSWSCFGLMMVGQHAMSSLGLGRCTSALVSPSIVCQVSNHATPSIADRISLGAHGLQRTIDLPNNKQLKPHQSVYMSWLQVVWAAWYITRLLVKLMPTGVLVSFSFLFSWLKDVEVCRGHVACVPGGGEGCGQPLLRLAG